MKINRQSDTLLNVFFPLLAGYLIYTHGFFHSFIPPLKNYLPDGLWAYSFLSALLIVWGRQVNFFWLIIVFLLSAGFELLQFLQWIAGTGDFIDILVYFSFFGFALLVNQFFSKQTKFHHYKISKSVYEKK